MSTTEIDSEFANLTKEPEQVDYFGTDETFRFVFPDGITYVEHKTLTEGDRRKFLKATSKGVKVEKNTGDTFIPLDPGGQRIELLKIAIIDWNMVSKGQTVAFSSSALDRFINSANPSLIEDIEEEIRNHNRWLLDDLTAEDIKEEIERLQDMLEEVEAREAGKEN